MKVKCGYLFACVMAVCSSLAVNAQDTLKKEDIPIVAKAAGLQFTEAEIDMMYPDVKDHAKTFIRMHRLPLDNSVPMSLWQSPLLPGMQVPVKQLPINWTPPVKTVLPAERNALAFYSIGQLAFLLRNRKLTSVELTHFFMDRLRKYGDTLQCVISFTEEIAMKQARAADADFKAGKVRSILQGIPYGLKDLFAVKGTKTTWGAAPYQTQEIDSDAFVYTQLEKAGAVLIAKFSLGALAMGDYWYGGRTKNPWNLKNGSSGSSAGSTAATVAGLVPFAIGTETYGSIVSPSGTCGATGLRPTFGSVSRTGAMTLSWSLDKIGPICRSAEDAAMVFSVIHGTDGLDGCAVNAAFNYNAKPELKQLKIAYVRNYFDKLDSNSAEQKVLAQFRSMGLAPVPIELVDSVLYPFDMIGIVIGAESSAAFDEFTRMNIDDQMTRQTRFDWPNYFRTARLIPATEYINTNRYRYRLMQQVNQLIGSYDAIIVPSSGNRQTAITNLTGHPVVIMPSGFSPAKLPLSITIIGKLYGEAAILALANAYQQQTPWEDQHPDMFH